MNGRLYDPRLHRFLQPDNNLQEPYNTQNYNRYGYVLNNPLKYTDPTGEFTWSDFVAGVAIVVGVGLLIASAGVLSPWSAGLIGSGVAHFGATASNYFSAGSETRGNWDASSTKAGINFSITKDTDLGGGSGKDKPNNNNPVENHPQVKTTGTSNTSYSNGDQTSTNNSALNNTLSKLKGFVENNETVMHYFMLTSGYTRKETLNLLSLKSLSKLVVVGNTYNNEWGSFNADKKHKGYDPTHIHIRADIIKTLETGIYQTPTGFHKINSSGASFFAGVTILHELVHYGRFYNGLPAKYLYENKKYEAGQIFEDWTFKSRQTYGNATQNSILYGW